VITSRLRSTDTVNGERNLGAEQLGKRVRFESVAERGSSGTVQQARENAPKLQDQTQERGAGIAENSDRNNESERIKYSTGNDGGRYFERVRNYVT
jgi:hypothetical protein